MYVTDFEFADKRLSDFNCIICVINGSSGVNEIDIGCDITFNTIKNNHTSKHSVTSSSYDNVYTTTFEITKNFCNSNGEDIYMTPLEVEAITTWLHRRTYKKFKVYNDFSSQLNVCYFGSFNSIKPIKLGDNVLGFSLTFTANTPYALGQENILEYTMDAESEIELHAESDEYGLVYPKVKIKCLSDGILKLTNHTTENYLYVSDCQDGETITIDGDHKIILSDKRGQNEIANCFNYEYFEMLVDEYNTGNVYSSTLPCELTICYRPVKKVAVM